MFKAKVIVKRLQSPHQNESFTKFQPLNSALRDEVFKVVAEIFDEHGGKALLKSSGDVYIKPNGIDSKYYCFTRPELVEAVIAYWKKAGARHIYLFENSTQSNFTRMVFALVGYTDICKKYGVTEIFLDEEKSVDFEFKGKKPEGEDEKGYRHTTFAIPKIIVDKLINEQDQNLYISLPKLKTHSMAGVTLGVKNQWAFPQQNDRRPDHNWNLPYKLADVLGYLQPDFTLTEGIEATVFGHYPVTAFADKCIKPFKVLLGSTNVVAADLVGSRLFGLSVDDVPHLKVAIERGYSRGVNSLDDVEIAGDISDFTQRYDYDLVQEFPSDVQIIKGKERLCAEGCKNNPLTLLQVLTYDYNGKGGWTLIMGKGFDPSEIDAIQGRVLVMGRCAATEIGDRLVSRLSKKNVYFSGHCNDLCATTNAMCHLTKISPLKLAPLPFFHTAKVYLTSLVKGTQANIPFLLADVFKVV
ncbi:MAG: DUF362 domain-containing protein [Oscillospiraceae bacterium]|nr:DUF362 domain-containing protein [Oscillospiraceae bacterium]